MTRAKNWNGEDNKKNNNDDDDKNKRVEQLTSKHTQEAR